MAFKLSELPYAYDALEPHIDARTMEIHHTKHHQGYTNKLNNAIEGTELEGKDIESILSEVSRHSDAVRNNAGGYYNHNLFWRVMSPNGGGEPEGDFRDRLDEAFGNFNDFKAEFSNAAKSRFGSGWAWLSVVDGELRISSTPNQDNPLMDVPTNGSGGLPILGLDVWEHAYYLKYQNKRPDYIESWWNTVNWDDVTRRYHELT